MNHSDQHHQNIPPESKPYWREDIDIPTFSAMTEDQETEVAIIGGGITGITTAYLLMKEGVRVTLIEAGQLFNGTTGHTTAKVTAQHSLIYNELLSHLGHEQAKKYYEASSNALNFIQQTVEQQNIDCDFIKQDAYVYATTQQKAKQIEKEGQAYEVLGINGGLTSSLPIWLPIESAVVMHNQAQFHPLKYVKSLTEAFVDGGGKIYEQTTAVDLKKGTKPIITMRNGAKLTCDHVVSCSHFPFHDGIGFYFSRMYQERSYIVAVKPKHEYAGGMYINAESPSRSLRSTPTSNGPLILVGGENHKTGQGINTMRHYEALASFAKETLNADDIVYRWSAQDLTTMDNIPYIGPLTSGDNNIFVATGFRKWGMTNSTVAAQLLCDQVLNRENPYRDVFVPSRFHADPSVRKWISTNADVAGHFVAGKVGMKDRHPEDLRLGEGAHVNVHGKKAAGYRDEDGKLHLLDATCTHMGCEVEWNEAERSWDCPCHGSRFNIDGEVLNEPADKPLAKIEDEHREA
ncbi:FAD-dependent oxidoreductase [Texcoconibacillus texcoconensis]|uniref:Glycine/D-amino acid oxidase-like deaminating enzyme/nitrite reductase/ring-hydroxylating ferredoxin subunit n=1 Tax=Texcoconibacillus texcoconensis TaxID=1095777 RepID=A0A840QS99_9BACI|nr:FAD-dependent oxidoreductase [Texcoconibacillus texcoconensis]MBB5174157.1 glycine/D-amino acid oxidase-like deaminating enzyme/nitrite reductase/ring-hydroxylating ferredoxin subunit [Texcoconibacillus texcoconensis]